MTMSNAATAAAAKKRRSASSAACSGVEPDRSGLGDENRADEPAIGRARQASSCSIRFPSGRNGARPAASSTNKVMSTSHRSSSQHGRSRRTVAQDKVSRLDELAGKQQLGHKSFWVSLLDENLVNGAFATDHPFVRYALQPRPFASSAISCTSCRNCLMSF